MRKAEKSGTTNDANSAQLQLQQRMNRERRRARTCSTPTDRFSIQVFHLKKDPTALERRKHKLELCNSWEGCQLPIWTAAAWSLLVQLGFTISATLSPALTYAAPWHKIALHLGPAPLCGDCHQKNTFKYLNSYLFIFLPLSNLIYILLSIIDSCWQPPRNCQTAQEVKPGTEALWPYTLILENESGKILVETGSALITGAVHPARESSNTVVYHPLTLPITLFPTLIYFSCARNVV